VLDLRFFDQVHVVIVERLAKPGVEDLSSTVACTVSSMQMFSAMSRRESSSACFAFS
jgi:hypothetical protein